MHLTGLWRSLWRRSRPRVLVVDHGIPTPDRDAGSRTMFQVLCLFADKGFRVDFWAPETKADSRYRDPLVARGIRLHRLEPAPSQSFERWLARNGGGIDHAFLSRPRMAAEVIDAIRRNTAAKVLFYGHDLHHLRMRMGIDHTGDPNQAQHADTVEAFENDIWRRVDTIYYPSPEECRYVKARCLETGHAVDTQVLPVFGFDGFEEPSSLSPSGRSGVLFVGGFAHPPNVDAILWFSREVWPGIVAAVPGARLTIIGSRPPPEVRALAGETIAVTGYVSEDSLERAYRSTRVAIAPLRFGAGMKGKVVEAMRFGVPMVTTQVGAQGLADAGDALLVSDDAARQGELLLDLLRDDTLWKHTAVAATNYVRPRFSRDRLWAALAAAL